MIEKISESDFLCKAGQFRLHIFRSVLDSRMHYALTLGDKPNNSTSLVRVQSANILIDALGLIEKGNDSNDIDKALDMIAENGSGTLLYMESRKHDFADKKGKADLRQASNTPKMDFRDYGIGAQILVALGIKKIRLLSRDRRKVVGLEGYGLEIVEHILLH